MIASHSSSRVIANHARNLTDDTMRALARNGGVVIIGYHAAFPSEEFHDDAIGPRRVKVNERR
jgi:membrane dipeptidase